MLFRAASLLVTLSVALAQTPQRGVTVRQPIAVTRKLALVIGNARYQDYPLQNPVNDAAAMVAALRKLHFDDVTEVRDADRKQMGQAIDVFALKLRPGDLALFYFAGHGAQDHNHLNYLIPVDFTGFESDLQYGAYRADQIADKLLSGGARLRILILDACRNNPFQKAAGQSRALGNETRGLAPMEAAAGTLIAYATAEGNVADDGQKGNGLFTGKLLETLQTPGLNLSAVFKQTQEAVYDASQGNQVPAVYDNVIGNFYFLGPVTITVNPPTGTVPPNAGPPPVAPAPASPKNPAEPTAFQTQVNQYDGLTYVRIPAGSFRMGCSSDFSGSCTAAEQPVHNVTLTRGFWMGESPVTRTGYLKVMGPKSGNWEEGGDGNMPADGISWEDADSYCGKVGMRLPTETEWEYGARAGTPGPSYGGLNAIAWYTANSDGHRHPVKQKQPNAFWLYDMLGDVREWVADWNGPYQPGSATDPRGPGPSDMRVLRGGSWEDDSRVVAASHRDALYPGMKLGGIGFRCAGEFGAPTIKPPAGAPPAPANPLPNRVASSGPKKPPASVKTEVKKDGLAYAWIPSGSFEMGCSPGDNDCQENEKPVHRVTITKGFWMGQTAVTQAAYQKAMSANPSRFTGAPQLPVDSVTFLNAQAYCAKAGLRLPTEAEWEYAARAGSAAPRYGQVGPIANLGAIAWFRDVSDRKTHPVAEKDPNDFGLYDMLGNISQWVSDWYGKYSETAASDPSESPTGPISLLGMRQRVLRGGSFLGNSRELRASYRFSIVSTFAGNTAGFRCVGNQAAN